MRSVEKQIRASIDSFVSELNALVRQAAVEAVKEALGATSASARRAVGRSNGKAAKAPASPRPRTARRRRRSKRSPRTLAKLETTLLGEITRNPGQRIEAIGKKLGVATKDLNLPIKKLIEARKIKKRGEKRATEYLPN
jgi:DNA-binding NtrC family response regulator